MAGSKHTVQTLVGTWVAATIWMNAGLAETAPAPEPIPLTRLSRILDITVDRAAPGRAIATPA